jgi:hypothetical protein
VRRTVATLLAVASPLLLATPVSASEDRLPAAGAHPAVMPAAPAPFEAAAPAAPAPVTLEAPALPAPSAAAPALGVPAAPAPIRHVVKTVRAKAPAQADLTDAAYAARLQAELCQARQIFCGLDRSGRYPAS